MKKIILSIFLLVYCAPAFAQIDTTAFIKRIPPDTSKLKMNMDAVYDRPFLQMGKVPVSVGGYLEANSSYFQTDGVTEGLSFQIPRLTIFMSSTIKKRIKSYTFTIGQTLSSLVTTHTTRQSHIRSTANTAIISRCRHDGNPTHHHTTAYRHSCLYTR